ncbi:tyrosine-protein kinase STYK1-like isoform X2 [Thalassophryne amazonica]|uniref:tyrosine-protein kinase STYK1-like isoform X2 n=1 Tax=Thalassophryne amazonica TaxID=390379 RepID=UPI0014710F0B|nr:tyrosine-protein kinase STYK1-like isoform X2 [Thalassophryne amazonica]
MSSKKAVELFYDVVSPYSWLGFEVMCRYRNLWNIDLKLRPAFLGGVMQGSGNTPPGMTPKKFMYMSEDLSRLAKYVGVPLQFPSNPVETIFKKGSLTAMRFVTAVQEQEKDGQKVEKVSRELWRRIWSEDKDITEPASLSEAATKAGLSDSEIKDLLMLSTSKEIKDKLKSTTQEALDHGGFGFPMVVCHINGKPEMFFGSDRFELIAHCLGEKWFGPQPGKSAAKIMSSLSNTDLRCISGDTLCEIRAYEKEVIVVPVLLLATFVVTLVFILLLHFCPEKVDRIRAKASKSLYRPETRRVLHGIDAPAGINVLEHESITLDMPSSYSTVQPPKTFSPKSFPLSDGTPSPPPGHPYSDFKPSFTPITQPRELPRQRLPESFNLVSPLPVAFTLHSSSSISLYRARMENKNVVLRVLKDSADATEKHNFLGFASFLSQLGPHPFLPELLGVVSLRIPLVTVVEELENRDLLSFLWRCREEHTDVSCEMTEKLIFTMAQQVASALGYLHSKELQHGNIRAHSVLVSKACTAKLWGLYGVYTRKNQSATQKDDPSMKKWQAPEVLAKRPASHGSDIWSFGILLYEMATLGEAPFAEIPVNELLQFHQRGKSLKKPPNCSSTLFSIIKSCSQWKEQDRPSLSEVNHKLLSGEKSASEKVIKGPGPVNIERYLQEAGYGESSNYTVF